MQWFRIKRSNSTVATRNSSIKFRFQFVAWSSHNERVRKVMPSHIFCYYMAACILCYFKVNVNFSNQQNSMTEWVSRKGEEKWVNGVADRRGTERMWECENRIENAHLHIELYMYHQTMHTQTFFIYISESYSMHGWKSNILTHSLIHSVWSQILSHAYRDLGTQTTESIRTCESLKDMKMKILQMEHLINSHLFYITAHIIPIQHI